MPIGGKLVLKGGDTLGVKKKKKRKHKSKADGGEGGGSDGEQQADGGGGGPGGSAPPGAPKAPDVQGITTKGKTYEQEFDLEMARAAAGKTRTTAWGSSFRAPPPILHGYDKKVSGTTASERLDLRAASKADKFAK